MFERFLEAVENRHEYARAWKARTGGQVFGYMCTYLPEEILFAAGILPVRILGSHEPSDVVEPHIHSMYCAFCRDVLAQGLTGRYDYLDGIAMGHTCIHIQQAFSSWQLHVPIPYSYYMFVPAGTQKPQAKAVMVAELEAFQRSLEGWLGQAISDEALDRAIDVFNINRRLLRQLYELRKGDPPAVSGVEAMGAALASMLMDKEEHNRLLEGVLQELPGRRNGDPLGVRLMLVGGQNDDIEFVRLVEELGGAVVIDDHCTGSRYFWQEVVPGEKRLLALASRYLDGPPCPTKDLEGDRRRLGHIQELARDYNVQGAIIIQQKFCDPHEIDTPAVQKLLRDRGIPTLFLEFDITIPSGQFRTRIEAFLEMIQMGVD
jgi:benzoyl-CoA reductase subunit C